MPLPESLRKVLDARKAMRSAMPAAKPEMIDHTVDVTVVWRDGRIFKNGRQLQNAEVNR